MCLSPLNHRFFLVIILLLILIVCDYDSSSGKPISDNLSGNYNLSTVRTDRNSGQASTLNQQYSINWFKKLLPLVSLRASINYRNFDFAQNQRGKYWRQQYQPSGDLAWKHDYFSAGINYKKRYSRSYNSATNTIGDNFGASFSTKTYKYPLLSFRLSNDHIYNENNRNSRDIRNRDIQMKATYNYKKHDFFYGLTQRNNKNSSSMITINEWKNNFRWNQTAQFLNKKLRFSSGYNFVHRVQTTKSPNLQEIFREIQLANAYYDINPTPEFGELPVLTGLSDGNINNATEPAINIGEGFTDRNIGAGFGYSAEIDAIYIYTDRPSSVIMGWLVFISTDNQNWDRVMTVESVGFNENYNRYEIEFQRLNAYYIKAVNTGINDVQSVFVTEIQVLSKSLESDKSKMIKSIHYIDLSSRYIFSSSLNSSIDISVRTEPTTDFSDSRDQYHISLSTRHNPMDKVSHSIRYQTGYVIYKSRNQKTIDSHISYSASYKPLETMEYSLSALSRSSENDNYKERETYSLFLNTIGNMLPGLNYSAGCGYTRNNIYTSRDKFGIWSFRFSSESAVTRSLSMGYSISRQIAKNYRDNSIRKRNQTSINSSWRITKTIYLRMAFSKRSDRDEWYFSNRINFSWRVTPKINLGCSYLPAYNMKRLSSRISYAFSRRTSFLLAYNANYFPGDEGANNTSINLNMKSGF